MFHQSKFCKIRVAVPVKFSARLMQAMAQAGAGRQGNYEFCFGSYRQIGRFRPLPGSSPAVGTVGKLEEVEEEIVEALCETTLLSQVIAAVKAVHPYEEPAIDIIPRLEIEKNG